MPLLVFYIFRASEYIMRNVYKAKRIASDQALADRERTDSVSYIPKDGSPNTSFLIIHRQLSFFIIYFFSIVVAFKPFNQFCEVTKSTLFCAN